MYAAAPTSASACFPVDASSDVVGRMCGSGSGSRYSGRYDMETAVLRGVGGRRRAAGRNQIVQDDWYIKIGVVVRAGNVRN